MSSRLRETVPVSGSMSPLRTFRKVVFPEPFLPTKPIFSPASMPSVTSSNRGWSRSALLTPARERAFIARDYTGLLTVEQRRHRACRAPQPLSAATKRIESEFTQWRVFLAV